MSPKIITESFTIRDFLVKTKVLRNNLSSLQFKCTSEVKAIPIISKQQPSMQLMTHEDNLNYNFIIGNVLFGLKSVILSIKGDIYIRLQYDF